MRLLAAIFIVFSFTSMAGEVKLSFREPVLRIDEQAKLKDLLIIRATDTELKMKLGKLPLVSNAGEISDKELVTYIRENIEIEFDIKWRGERHAVLKQLKKVSSESIKTEMEAPVNQWVEETFGSDAGVLWLDYPDPLVIETSQSLLGFELDPRGSSPRQIVGYLKTGNDKQVLAKHRRRVLISIKKPVYVATCSLNKGTVLNDECFQRRTEIIENKLCVGTNSKLSLLRLTSPLESGQILLQEAVKTISMIEAGDRVLATYSRNAIMIDSFAIAKQSGSEGDRIQVLIPSSGSELPAVVTRKGRVTINGS
ncbi:flagellar basal body P-ring formation chaperone FlgA [Photobacterium kasasachensis]|uniref:flagellar basal body P-ring formation chaperone FlgA n=1 Tax=Photobacterium kasasachensis TaxID=2910240 RepID=UPI003D0D6133